MVKYWTQNVTDNVSKCKDANYVGKVLCGKENSMLKFDLVAFAIGII